MTPKQAAYQIRRKKAMLERDLAKAQLKAMQAGLKVALRYSRGTLSYPLQRALDYPYATRHGSPLKDASIINIHTGEFYRGWKIEETVDNSVCGGITYWINNDSHAATFLAKGTWKMFQRPINERIEKVVRKRYSEEIKKAFTRAGFD